jgi:hypothetical protein
MAPLTDGRANIRSKNRTRYSTAFAADGKALREIRLPTNLGRYPSSLLR